MIYFDFVTMRAWPVARSIFDAPYVREANEGTTSWITILALKTPTKSQEAVACQIALTRALRARPPKVAEI